MCGTFSGISGLHAQLEVLALCIVCISSLVKYVPQYIQLTMVACLADTELIPACCHIRIGTVVERESTSANCEDDLGRASALSFSSQISEMTVRQCERHLSGLHGCCRYCIGSGADHTQLLSSLPHRTNQRTSHQRVSGC